MIRSTQLENGIRIVTERMQESRSVAIGMLMDVSPRDERADQEGLAHMIEHALFHGTSSRSSTDIARMVDMVGGRVAAFTTRDYTCFNAVVMDDHRTYIFDLLADILLNSIFPEEKLNKEIQVVLAEMQMSNDNPAARAHSLLKKSIWPNHPLGRDIEGNSETVSQFTRENLIYFLHANYLPNRMIVAVAGNLEHDDIVAQFRDCFWRLSGESTTPELASPVFQGAFVREEIASQQSYFNIAFEAPSYADEKRYEVHLLNSVLGGGLSARLYRELRETNGLVYDIGSEYHAYSDAGAIVVSGNTSPENMNGVVDTAISLVAGIIKEEMPVTEEELWHAKQYTIGQLHIDSQDPYTRMSRLLTQYHYFNKPIPIDEVANGIDEVTLQSMAEASSEIFQGFPENLSVAVVGPDF